MPPAAFPRARASSSLRSRACCCLGNAAVAKFNKAATRAHGQGQRGTMRQGDQCWAATCGSNTHEQHSRTAVLTLTGLNTCSRQWASSYTTWLNWTSAVTAQSATHNSICQSPTPHPHIACAADICIAETATKLSYILRPAAAQPHMQSQHKRQQKSEQGSKDHNQEGQTLPQTPHKTPTQVRIS